jgi:hypothetical protein
LFGLSGRRGGRGDGDQRGAKGFEHGRSLGSRHSVLSGILRADNRLRRMGREGSALAGNTLPLQFARR